MIQDLHLHPKITVRLLNDKNEKIFGPGIARLLELVEQTGSLRASCAKMEMAYSKAWKVIKNCETDLGFALLERKTGGEDGGGSVITEKGKNLLHEYRAYENSLIKKGAELI